MNPERFSSSAEKIFLSEDNFEQSSADIDNHRLKLVSSGEVGFDPIIGEEVGTRNAWIKAGYPSIRRQIEQSSLEPITTLPYREFTAKLWSRSQIEEILSQRDQRLENSQRVEGLLHPETNLRVHSVAGWAKELGLDRKKLTGLFSELEAKSAFAARLNNGPEIGLYDELTVKAAQTLNWEKGLGYSEIAPYPKTGQVVGSALAWAQFLDFSSPDVINRRTTNEDVVGWAKGARRPAKLYGHEQILKFFSDCLEKPENEWKNGQLQSLLREAKKMQKAEHVELNTQGEVFIKDQEYCFTLEPSSFKEVRIAKIPALLTCPERWQRPVFAYLVKKSQKEQLLSKIAAHELNYLADGVEVSVSESSINTEGWGFVDGNKVGTIQYFAQEFPALDKELILKAMKEGLIKPMQVDMVSRHKGRILHRQIDVYKQSSIEILNKLCLLRRRIKEL